MSIRRTTNLTKLRDAASALTTAARARRLTTEQLSEAINLLNVHSSEFSPQSCGLGWLRAYIDADPDRLERVRSQINMCEVYWSCKENPCIAQLFDEPLIQLIEATERIDLMMGALRSMTHVTAWCFIRAREIGGRRDEIAHTLVSRLKSCAPSSNLDDPYFERTIDILLDGAGQWATAGHKDGQMQWTFNAESGVWSLFDSDLKLHDALVRCAQLQPAKLLTPKRPYPNGPTMTEELMSRFGGRPDGRKLVSEIFFEAAKAMPTLTAMPPEVLLDLSAEHQLALIHQFDGCSLPYLIRKAAGLSLIESRFSMFDQYVSTLCEQAGESLPDVFCALHPMLKDMKDRQFAAYVDVTLVRQLRQLGYVVATLQMQIHKDREQLVAFHHNGYADFTYAELREPPAAGKKSQRLKAGDRVIFDARDTRYLARYVRAVRFQLVPGGRRTA